MTLINFLSISAIKKKRGTQGPTDHGQTLIQRCVDASKNEENDEENEQNQTELEETPNGVDGWTDQNQLEDAKAGHELYWDEVGGQGIKTRVGREVRPPKRYGQEEE